MEHADDNDSICSEFAASSPTATVGSSINVVDDNVYANEGEGSAVETACGSSKRTPEGYDATPARKKAKSKRESSLEKMMTIMISKFAAQEQAAEESFLKKEEEHRIEERANK